MNTFQRVALGGAIGQRHDGVRVAEGDGRGVARDVDGVYDQSVEPEVGHHVVQRVPSPPRTACISRILRSASPDE